MEGSVRAFENKSIIIRPPDVVKNPPFLPKLKTYTALIIGENINRALVILSWLGFGCGPVCGRKCRGTFIELRVLRESKTVLVFIMAEEPKNVWQARSARKRL